MSIPYGIERRDPASGVLSLGKVLTRVRSEGSSGLVDVRDGNGTHAIHVERGTVVGIDTVRSGFDVRADLRNRVERIFGLQRPHVVWKPEEHEASQLLKLDPNVIIVSGVASRQDLFEPRPLIDRIPVETLRIKPDMLRFLSTLPLSPVERAFVDQLTIPTPITMALWKRGLHPSHAGALLVALNLTGCFAGHWEPGDLPRSSLANTIRRKMKSGCEDFDILGVGHTASSRELDRAFRRLSFELHPDRVAALPEEEARRAVTAFTGISQAYDRIRRSRRKRPVREDTTDLGRVNIQKRQVRKSAHFLHEAKNASARGDQKRAKAFAMKALAASPENEERREIMAILSRAA